MCNCDECCGSKLINCACSDKRYIVYVNNGVKVKTSDKYKTVADFIKFCYKNNIDAFEFDSIRLEE